MANGKNASALSGAVSGATTGATIGGPWGAAIGGGLGLAAGYFGGQDDESGKYQKEMMDRINAIQVPGMEQLTFTPEELQYLGDFSPEQLQTYMLEKSAMENVAVDPRLKTEQMKALDKVSQLADQGFSDEDMMAFNIARQQAAGEAEAKQGQILQNMQARGQGGSGNELISRLTSAQNSANQLSLEQQKQAMAQAEARKQALTMLANQSGSMRNQDFGEQSAIAQAKDVVNQINTRNQQDVARYNVGSSNQAGQRNLETKQGLSSSNVALRNKAKEMKADAAKERFNMEMAKATGQNYISQQQAKSSQQGAADSAAGIGQIGQGAIQLAGMYKKPQTAPMVSNQKITPVLSNPSSWQEDEDTTNLVSMLNK
jgi:hypothetical protein